MASCFLGREISWDTARFHGTCGIRVRGAVQPADVSIVEVIQKPCKRMYGFAVPLNWKFPGKSKGLQICGLDGEVESRDTIALNSSF